MTTNTDRATIPDTAAQLIAARELMGRRVDRLTRALIAAQRELGYCADGQVDRVAIEACLRVVRGALR